MAKWVQAEQQWDGESAESDNETLTTAMYGQQQSKWLPRSLELLFGGRKQTDLERQMEQVHWQTAYTEEGRLMELLVDEAEGKVILDDSKLEGSGDDFDG